MTDAYLAQENIVPIDEGDEDHIPEGFSDEEACRAYLAMLPEIYRERRERGFWRGLGVPFRFGCLPRTTFWQDMPYPGAVRYYLFLHELEASGGHNFDALHRKAKDEMEALHVEHGKQRQATFRNNMLGMFFGTSLLIGACASASWLVLSL